MPIFFHVKTETNLLICIHTGKVPDNEFLTSYKNLYVSDRFSTSMNQLVDLRKADSSPRSMQALQEFAGIVKDKFKNVTTGPKVAVIAPENLSFGLSRMYQGFSTAVPWNFVVFRAADAALAWLDVPEDTLDNL
ncbi:hypothetical protein ACFL7D_09915 [candidate division KSB1 bacterium]